MFELNDPFRILIADKIYQATKGLGLEVERDTIYMALVEPPQLELGDLAYPCFQLSKLAKKSPVELAKNLAQLLQNDSTFKSVKAAGPYLNFIFSEDFIGKVLLAKIQTGEFFRQRLVKDSPKTMIEYSQPNTHKELHVGHMRNACLGDSLVRLMRYAGFDIISTTFPGDVGTHVAKALWYLKYHNRESIPATQKGEWLGQMYSKGHLLLEDQEKTAQAAENKMQLTEILRQLEAKQGPFFDLWQETRQWSIELMQQVYQWAGISFDKWYWESEVDSASVHYVQSLFAQGKLIKSEGAIGMDLEAEGLGFCLLLKSDGTGLYATKDLELARRKFEDFKIEKSIYVVDMRQALHFRQVFKVLENLGFEQAKNCFHLQYNFVELPDGAMSSRKGNIVPILDLVSNMEKMVKENYLNKYRGEWSDGEIDSVAHHNALGAIKYGMTKMDTSKKIVFDMKEWLKVEGDSGPSIQYAAARINSLCRKLEYSPNSAVDWSLLVHPSEHALMQALMMFHSTILLSVRDYRPSILCTYLFDLSKKFNYFYHECSVGNAATESLKLSRLALSFTVGEILKKGLDLLGIPTPERM